MLPGKTDHFFTEQSTRDAIKNVIAQLDKGQCRVASPSAERMEGKYLG